jgi:hypothetical protein
MRGGLLGLLALLVMPQGQAANEGAFFGLLRARDLTHSGTCGSTCGPRTQARLHLARGRSKQSSRIRTRGR